MEPFEEGGGGGASTAQGFITLNEQDTAGIFEEPQEHEEEEQDKKRQRSKFKATINDQPPLANRLSSKADRIALYGLLGFGPQKSKDSRNFENRKDRAETNFRT